MKSAFKSSIAAILGLIIIWQLIVSLTDAALHSAFLIWWERLSLIILI